MTIHAVYPNINAAVPVSFALCPSHGPPIHYPIDTATERIRADYPREAVVWGERVTLEE